MPDGDDPDRVLANSIEEPVGLDVNFAKGEVGEFGNGRPRMG
jgi:hypothetical protein